mmetsp:Transcript_34677/g.100516  ORF Transcript_34677/g.100516 Transcript_34677/m.100516 type:complete len:335 (-) Transcript_34677:517-1521(-)
MAGGGVHAAPAKVGARGCPRRQGHGAGRCGATGRLGRPRSPRLDGAGGRHGPGTGADYDAACGRCHAGRRSVVSDLPRRLCGVHRPPGEIDPQSHPDGPVPSGALHRRDRAQRPRRRCPCRRGGEGALRGHGGEDRAIGPVGGREEGAGRRRRRGRHPPVAAGQHLQSHRPIRLRRRVPQPGERLVSSLGHRPLHDLGRRRRGERCTQRQRPAAEPQDVEGVRADGRFICHRLRARGGVALGPQAARAAARHSRWGPRFHPPAQREDQRRPNQPMDGRGRGDHQASTGGEGDEVAYRLLHGRPNTPGGAQQPQRPAHRTAESGVVQELGRRDHH